MSCFGCEGGGVDSGHVVAGRYTPHMMQWAGEHTTHIDVLFGLLKEVGVICRSNGGLEVGTRDTFTAGWHSLHRMNWVKTHVSSSPAARRAYQTSRQPLRFRCFCGVSARQLVIAPEATAWRPQLAHMLRRVMDG